MDALCGGGGSSGVILVVEDCRSWVRVLNKISMAYTSMTPIYYTYPGGKNSWMHYVVVEGGSSGVILGVEDCRSWDSVLKKKIRWNMHL